MRGYFPIFTSGFILTALAGIPLAAQDNNNNNLPTLSITPFTGDKVIVPDWQPIMGQGLSQMLVESLENSSNKFQVIDTVAATPPKPEPAPAGAGPADNARASGRRSGAGSAKPGRDFDARAEKSDSAAPAAAPAVSPPVPDFTFYADVTQFTMQTNVSKVGDFFSKSHFAGFGGELITAHIEIAWRIVDTVAQKIVKRGITACTATGSEFVTSGSAATNVSTSGTGNTTTAANAAPTTVTNKTLAAVGTFFSGLGKAFSSSNSGSSGGRAGAAGATTTASAKRPPKPAAEPGGEAPANDVETYGYANPKFIKSALGKASAEAVADIISQLTAFNLPEPERIAALQKTPGKVLAVVDNHTIVVSLGSNQGFKEGDHLKLYEISDIKDDKGNVVFTDEKMVGAITLSEVQADKSLGSYAGDAKVQQGWTVKAR